MSASGIGTPEIPALFVLAVADNQNLRVPAFAVQVSQAEASWTATLPYARETGRHPVLWAGGPSQAAAWLGSRPYRARPAAHAQPIDDAAELLVQWARERPAPDGGAAAGSPLVQGPMPDEMTLLLPAARCWEVPAVIGWGGDGSMPDPEEHVALFQRWHEQFLAEPYLLGPNWAQFVVRRPPLTMEAARELAWMHYLYAPLCLNRRTPTLDTLASELCGSAKWSFVWDIDGLPGQRGRAPLTAHDQATVSLTRHVAGVAGTSAIYGSASVVADDGSAPGHVDRASDAGTAEADSSSRRNAESTSGVATPTEQHQTPAATAPASKETPQQPEPALEPKRARSVGQAKSGRSDIVINTESARSRHIDAIEQTGFWSMVRQLPAAVRAGMSLGWRADRFGLLALLFVHFVGGLAQGIQLLFISRTVQSVLGMKGSADRADALLTNAAVLAGCYAFSSIADAVATVLVSRVGPRVKQTAKEDILRATTEVEVSALEDPDFSDDLEAANRGADGSTALFGSVISLLGGIGRVAAALAVLGLMNVILIPLMILAVVPKAVAAVKLARIGYSHFSASVQQMRRSRVLVGYLTGERSAAEVRTFNLANFLLGQWRELMVDEAEEERNIGGTRARTGLGADILTGLMNVLVFGFLLYALASGLMPLAAAGTGLLGIMMLRNQTTLLFLKVSGLYESGLYAGELRSWLAQAKKRVPPNGSRHAPGHLERIDVHNVAYRYPGSERDALHQVSLQMRRGEVIALVGENGSGKTTLAKVLAALYEPVEGEVRWDGVDVRDFDRKSVWSQLALIPQHFTQWPLTAELNIAVGNLERYEREGSRGVYAAAASAGAHGVINGLKDGYDTLLGKSFSNGISLSGGQWQRLAIARAVYRNASLLIADEPSAALDARAEHEMFEMLRNLAQDRILLLITHRLSSVRMADRVYVLKEGRVIQSGTHDELVRQDGLYQELYTMQARSFTD